MRAVATWLLISAWLYALCAQDADAAPASASLCRADETVYFACLTAHSKSINLCGGARSVQYRFGRTGQTELSYPPDAAVGKESLFYAHYMLAQVDRVEIRFDSQGSEYVVYDHREGSKQHSGVRVSTPDGKEHEIACTGAVASRLGELEKVLPCNADSALNGGLCPRSTEKPR